MGTVSLYLQRTARHGLGWPLPVELDDAALEARLYPRATALGNGVGPDCAHMHRELKRDGVTLQLLWEEYARVQRVHHALKTRNAKRERKVHSRTDCAAHGPCGALPDAEECSAGSDAPEQNVLA